MKVVVVADGAGGTGGGAAAAELVVEEVRRVAAGWVIGDTLPMLTGLLVELDVALLRVGQATAVLAVVSDSQITGCSVGDSGAWLITTDALIDLTVHQKRKPLLGTGQARPVAFSAPWTDGVLLVATDGLLKYAPERRVADVARGGTLAAAAARARRAGDIAVRRGAGRRRSCALPA